MVTLWTTNEIAPVAIAGLQDPQLSSRPSLFYEEISRRSYNASTATIEEIDADPPTPPADLSFWVEGAVKEEVVADRPVLSQVPHSTPAVGSNEGGGQSTPATAPQSFGPPGLAAKDDKEEIVVE